MWDDNVTIIANLTIICDTCYTLFTCLVSLVFPSAENFLITRVYGVETIK